MIAAAMTGTAALAEPIHLNWEPRPAVEVFYPSQTLSLELRLRIGSETLSIRYSLDAGLPTWFAKVRQSIEGRCTDQMGWDGYSALPTNHALVVRLLNCLDAAMPGDGRAPVITPLGDGGVQAEWHRNGSVLELVVPSNEPARYYFYDPVEEKEEREFENNEEAVRRLISRF